MLLTHERRYSAPMVTDHGSVVAKTIGSAGTETSDGGNKTGNASESTVSTEG